MDATSRIPKLPKQWKYWCQKSHLEPLIHNHWGLLRKEIFWHFLKIRGNIGKDCFFRVDEQGTLNLELYRKDSYRVSILYCEVMAQIPIPKTEKEFLEFVKY